MRASHVSALPALRCSSPAYRAAVMQLPSASCLHYPVAVAAARTPPMTYRAPAHAAYPPTCVLGSCSHSRNPNFRW